MAEEKGTFEQALDRQAGQSMGAMEAVREGLKEFRDTNYPGLTFGKIWNDLKQEAVQQVQHGAHELAAALNNGSAFVMYPRGGKDDHGVHGPEQAQGQEGPGGFEAALDRQASRGSVHGQDKGMER